MSQTGDSKSPLARLERRLERERLSRLEAEALLERKSLELFEVNEKLRAFVQDLELQVESRTTELRLALEHAEHLTRKKANFLAAVSHEIRTPLNGIVGTVELLAEGETDPTKHRYVNALKSSVEQLLHVVNDTLDISAANAGALPFRKATVDIRACLTNLLTVYEPMAHTKHLTVSLKVEESVPPFLLLDEMRIRQVVSNLVSNGLKYTDKGGVSIVVRLDHDAVPSHLIVSVSDTGPGIENELLPELFDAFRRGLGDETLRIQGTGLGLALSKKLADLLGGSLIVDSPPGNGATFILSVPVETASAPDAAPRSHATPQPSTQEDQSALHGVHVLIVDDNEINRMLLAETIGPRVRRVTQARDGIEAIELLATERFDAIVLDLRMPRMNGIDAAKAIRADERHSRVPIIGLSASVTQADRVQAEAAGFNALREKPIRSIELLAALTEALTKRRPGSGELHS